MEDHQESLVVRQIYPPHVANLWHWIKPGVREILDNCPDDFEPEDVFCALWQQKASAFLILEDGEFKGFMVLEVMTDPFKGRRTLSVWLLHYKGAEETQEAIYEHLEKLKTLVNCCRIWMRSPRLGWLKKAKGWKLKLITWEKE